MFDPASLAAAALVIATTYLAKTGKKVADETADLIGNKIVEWIKSKLDGGMGAEAVAKIAENPESKSARMVLEGSLLERLEGDEALAAELAALLKEAEQAGYSIKQELHQTGDMNIGVQVAGDKNKINLPHRD